MATSFERWTERARRILILATEQARELGDPFVGAEHILLALMREGESIPANFLRARGVIYSEVLAHVKRCRQPAVDPRPTA